MKYNRGPKLPISIQIDEEKYRGKGETFDQKIDRIARHLCDNQHHYSQLDDIFGSMRFLPAGRVQSACGSPREVTAFNCFASDRIDDSVDSIMKKVAEACETMRRGGGIGMNFSHIRPMGDWIKSLDSKASGPVSFMGIWDAMCKTISSAGNRRGAMMGILNISHPDIEEFITAKQNSTNLTGFNISIGVTDKFMECLKSGEPFPLEFEGKTYRTVDPNLLWDKVMQSTYDWAEPGVVFIDKWNEWNNLHYCEEIEVCNPCSEQPLGPNSACLLGSFCLPKYITEDGKSFNFKQLEEDIPHVVRAMDNVNDRTIYPLPAQEQEAINKRRMGLGVTGLANAAEMLGMPYASKEFMVFMEDVLTRIRDHCYMASSKLAQEKGAFPLYDKKEYLKGKFIQTLSPSVIKSIEKNGIRNSHVLSIAPCGTISLMCDNVSSSIEPVFSHYYDRTIIAEDGESTFRVEDFAYARGIKGRTADEISVDDHVKVLALAQMYVDSAVSKTCNVGPDITFDQFKNIYQMAYDLGCKGISTFRASGKRFGVLNKVEEKSEADQDSQEGVACEIDPLTGVKTCDL